MKLSAQDLYRLFGKWERHPTRGCWVWGALEARSNTGTPIVSVQGRNRPVRKLLREVLLVCETPIQCATPGCVHPDHARVWSDRRRRA